MKLIIKTRDDIPMSTAIVYVEKVMAKGRISQARGIKHYCWACVFESGIVVAVRQKKTKDSADSFIVYKDKK